MDIQDAKTSSASPRRASLTAAFAAAALLAACGGGGGGDSNGSAAPVSNTPAQFRDVYTKEVAKWEKFFRTTGIKL